MGNIISFFFLETIPIFDDSRNKLGKYSSKMSFRMIVCLLMFMAGGKSFYYAGLLYVSVALVYFLVNLDFTDVFFL